MPKKKAGYQELLDKIHLPGWVILVLAAIFIFRIPSFFEPYHYGDELIYLSLGEGIRKGLVLFRDIHDNKPPLLYLLAAVAGNVFWFRAILAGWMMVTTGLFFKLVQALFPKEEKIQKVSTIVFAILTTIPLLEGQIANAELFMAGPTIAAFYIIFTKKLTAKNLILSGVLFSLATLFKVPAAFDIAAIVFIWIAMAKIKRADYVAILRSSTWLLVGFISPIALTILFYAAQGAFNEYLTAAFLQNVGYVSTFRPGDVAEPFFVKNAPLIYRAVLTALGLGVLYVFRNKLSRNFMLASAWLLVSLFAVTLSERPYPHYLLQSVPSISILLGILVAKKSIEQSLAIIPLFLAVLVPVFFSFWYYPTFSYYQRFLQFASGSATKSEYFAGFNGAVNRNYKISEYINSTSLPSDKVFVWGDSAPIYALSRRLPPIKYVANYHIVDFSSQEEVGGMLLNNPPTFIVILPSSDTFPELSNLIFNRYLLAKKVEGADIYKLMSPEMIKALR